MTTAADTYVIDGRTVHMPVGVRDAVVASASFVVPAGTVSVWLPDGLSPLPAGPGRTLLMLSAIHYRDNDLGEYREISIAVAVHRGLRTGTFIHRLPVDDEFSRAAGQEIWGFPKTVEALEITPEAGGTTGQWRKGDDLVLRLTVEGRGTRPLPVTTQRAYTVIGGKLHETRFLLRATGFSAQRGGAHVDLGYGDAADELRRLGLPRPAAFSMTMARMQALFDAPRPVA